MRVSLKLTTSLIIGLLTCVSRLDAAGEFVRNGEGVTVTVAEGQLRILPLTRNAVRIQIFKDPSVVVPDLVLVAHHPPPMFDVSESPAELKVLCGKIAVVLDKRTGALSFADSAGNVILDEKPDTRKLLPDSVMGEPCVVAEQAFVLHPDEHLWGLGQFQDGHYDLRNVTRRLTQVNSQIAIPFVYSSRGFGLLWHQYGLTDFNPADNTVLLEKLDRMTQSGATAEVTTTAGTEKVAQDQSLYAGRFNAPADGEYSIFLDLGDMGNRHYVAIDSIPCIDESNFWLPPTASALVRLKAGDHTIRVVCKSSNTPRISWKVVDGLTTFRSPHARSIDYVVFSGTVADSVIGAYRALTGGAPMLPRWAYGFWQCRERYASGTHLVETVKEFRKRRIPMDVIVQDWQYWGKYGWGVMKFDETHYPNPAGFIRELHDLNAHFNISVWENLDKNSDIGKGYASRNFYLPESPWVDMLNPEARKFHWAALNEHLFSLGVDSWWMDATEPENDGLKGKRTFLGAGDFYRLTYPLFVSQAVYEGQRNTTSDKRVCILTRSAFPGQQRYGTINWSGDVGGTWDSFRRQIVAGLNFTITGLPYWTTDIGGFFRPGPMQYTDPHYHELLIRWFQWGAFNPIFRVHGYQSETEPWKYGQKVETAMRTMLELRYRLLPYIYSEAWAVTRSGSTMMRPLVMDFGADTVALTQRSEFMFGKALLVAPITEPGVAEWNVYLPACAGWYDFWTGRRFVGGHTARVVTSWERIPLMVRAGAIIPMGPSVQSTAERSDPLEIRVYPGADGEYTLYEDENDGYGYETGAYSTITLKWNDAKKVLTVSARSGAFSGMIASHRMNILLVSEDKGTGLDPVGLFHKRVDYAGKEIVIRF
jgi:alpha-D-xyloside xylohydrolase